MQTRDKISATFQNALIGLLLSNRFERDVENDRIIDEADAHDAVIEILEEAPKWARIMERMWRYEQLHNGAAMELEEIAAATCPKMGSPDERFIALTDYRLKAMREHGLVNPGLAYNTNHYWHVVGIGQELCEHVLGY